MKKVFLLLTTSATQILQTQNIGINIAIPQATVDVKGSQGTGGINNHFNK
jgi:hypothetical protein